MGYFIFARGLTGDFWLGGSAVPGMTFAGKPVQSTSMSDVLLLHYDPTGAPVALRQFGSKGMQTADSMVFSKLGVPVIEGRLEGTADFGQGPLSAVGDSDVFIAKLGP